MNSFTNSGTQVFTITHAKKIASKVATDLKRLQRFYSSPSDSDIQAYETEVIELLKEGCLGTVTYGFKKDDKWIEPTLRYTAKDFASMSAVDDDPGRITPGVSIAGASFYSFLTYSSKWDKLTTEEKDGVKKTLPFYRTGANEPGINGYLSNDKTYTSGGKSLERSTVKNY
jgi:hypothetical protein